ncbi:MAG TPA: AMP-binding protein [Macromonas sp.]|nr:AMP-binding protein [Macromonas sp.]
MSALPLITAHGLDSVLAWRPEGPVRVGEFVAEVQALAQRLPAGAYVLNLCEDRYHFAVGFAAGLLAGKVSLQPSSQSPDTLARLAHDYPGLVCLTDRAAAGALSEAEAAWPTLRLPLEHAAPLVAATSIPEVAADATAVMLFTSGSVGVPQPHPKSWGKLVQNGRVEAQALGLTGRPHHIVGTVPVQHSYGFESTLLLALHGGCTFWSGKPFYPQDVVEALAAVPSPRLLVSTPYHLSALQEAGLPWPPVDMLLSATAALSVELAERMEQLLQAPLFEIYGSTESSALASRRTTAGAPWQLLPGVQLEQEGEHTFASGGHVQERVRLSDFIELLSDGRFLLQGRHADLVNIAGKRTSLAYLNHQILRVPGVQDAAFFLPDDASPEGVTRLAAFVVAPGQTRAPLLAALRQYLDPVFLPRPLLLLPALPRNSTGKLPRQALQALYQELYQEGALHAQR